MKKRPIKDKIQDRLLFSRLKKKDREAFIKAYDLYIDDLFRFIFFKVSGQEEAKDLTSEVFLKAWDHILNNNISDHKTLRSLLYKIARNLIIDHYRKKKNISSLDTGLDIIDHKQDPVKEMEILSDYENLEKKLSELKDEYREALVLRYINELSIGEIALILEKSKGNVRILIYRAIKSLRDITEEENKD